MTKSKHDEILEQLDQFYNQAKRQILQNQSAITGLFPSNSAEKSSASIKTSLWAASSIFALYLAYSKRVDNDQGKAHDLGQSVVKCMRGILFAWMRQSERVEAFKANQCPKHALHLKFDLHSGLANDSEYPHLQIDVVSLYLIFLANFIASGLDIIYCMDEVTFIQNLVYYVERAYRTPDYCNWEAYPNKTNNSNSNSQLSQQQQMISVNPPQAHTHFVNSEPQPYNQHDACVDCSHDGKYLEIHASAIGMAKAALEAINGCNLFGGKGANWSIIYSDIDAHSRNRNIFETLLPRESRSKNTDSYLLAAIGWPCFATNDPPLYNATKSKILRKLKGKYGFKRFLRDPYGTVLNPDSNDGPPVQQYSNNSGTTQAPPTSILTDSSATVAGNSGYVQRETSFSSTTSGSSLSLGEQPRAKQRKSSYHQRKNFFRTSSANYQAGQQQQTATDSTDGGAKANLESVNRSDSASKMSKRFEHIESEWPLFVCFLIIDGIFKQDLEQIYEYEKLLYERLLKIDLKHGDYLMPKYYYVPPELINNEKCNPDTVERLASAEGSSSEQLFLTGQSILLITRLLLAGLVHPNELDPLRRHMPSHDRPKRIGRYSSFQATSSDLVVQTVLIAESIRLQAMMANYGIQTQTPLEVEPVQIWSSTQLIKVYEYLGVNEKLGLKGRPSRPIGALGTSKLYRICGQTIICYPLIFEVSDFYLAQDMLLLIDDIQNELNFIGRYWRMSGRPTVCILIREEHLRDVHFRDLLDLLVQFKNGQLIKSGLRIKTGRLQNLINSSCIEHLDFLHLLPHEHLSQFESFRQLVESPKQSLLTTHLHASRGTTSGRSSNCNLQASNSMHISKSRRLLCSASSHDLQAIEEQSLACETSAPSPTPETQNDENNAELSCTLEEVGINMSDASMYKFSSLDLEQTYSTGQSPQLDYYECYKGAPTWPTLIDLLRACDEPSGQSQLLAILLEREGPKYCIDDVSVEERLEQVSQLACTARNWSVVRYCSAVLRRSVDSLSPWLTSILVNGKQISLGIAQNEKIINNPLTPTEIQTLIYSTASIKNPCDAVLQQEIALYIGRLISTRPDYFEGILTIRVANFMSAMRSYLNIRTTEKQQKQQELREQQLQQEQTDNSSTPAETTSPTKLHISTALGSTFANQQLLDLRIKSDPGTLTKQAEHTLGGSSQSHPAASSTLQSQEGNYSVYGTRSAKPQIRVEQSRQGIKLATTSTAAQARPQASRRPSHNLVARSLESLSPSGVRKLLVRVLSVDEESMPISDRRQITGELCRVPKNFYDKVWSLLHCTNAGIIIGGKMLRSVPTLTNMTQDDLNFALKVESLLGSISCPKLRQVNVELLVSLHVIFERNSEIKLDSEPIDLEKIINLALDKFRADNGRDDFGLREFYCNSTQTVMLYTVRTVFDCLLPNKFKGLAECRVS